MGAHPVHLREDGGAGIGHNSRGRMEQVKELLQGRKLHLGWVNLATWH